MRPNVLIVVLDAARRDSLEPYGAEVGASPAVAQLARRGVAYEDVHATAPWTVPSHASMFTGMLPRAAGLSRVGSPADLRGPLSRHRGRLLHNVLGASGYSTGAASANLWLSRATGFDEGFDDFAEITTDRNAKLHVDALKARLHWYGEAVAAKADDGARQIAALLEHWGADGSRRPFCWFVNLLECHSPYLPPRPYGGWAPVRRLRAAADARRHYTLAGFWRACVGVDEVPDDVLERGRRLYAASIRYMDDWLASVLDGLDGHGVLDDTLVVVLSDHGENFGEDGLIGHGLSLDNRLIHVPFVAAGPGSEALAMTSLVDLPRRLALAVGLDEHPWEARESPDVAVAEFDPPVAPGDEEGREKLRGIGIDGAAAERFTTSLSCAIRGHVKLVRRGAGADEVVFDLATDPDERDPIAAGSVRPDLAVDVEHLRRTLDGHAARGEDSSAEATSGSATSEEIRELEERMKLLGYM